jgi:hypothetical protein
MLGQLDFLFNLINNNFSFSIKKIEFIIRVRQTLYFKIQLPKDSLYMNQDNSIIQMLGI